MIKCDDVALQTLLDADEEHYCSTVNVAEVEQHVESCSHCQNRLSQLAAEDRQWDEIPTWLAPSDLPDEVDGKSLDARERWKRPTAWTESIAKSLLETASHPEMLGRIGRYDVERLVGSGGMGVVSKAWDTELNRPVAVKLLAPYLAENGSARKRFAREARAAAAVVDEHVVAIHNVESGDDPQQPPFLVMKYIAGGSLQQRLDRDGPLEVCEIIRIGMQTAKGLAAAHAQGLIHRDVKPSNILLDEGVERALLTDFGLARAEDDAALTRSGFHPGTPHYMSPEQVRGEAIDARSDLFGLGCVLYALCTGHPPFRAETSYAVLRRITDDTARPIRELNPDIPEWLERIVMKLLCKSREDRFDSAEEAGKLLEGCLEHVQQPTIASLPKPVAKLARVDDNGRDKVKTETHGGFRYPPAAKLTMVAGFVFSLIFAGVLIVLELQKGTLTIESDADAVPIRIIRGEDVVKNLIVDRQGATTRLHAGHYTLEVHDPNTKYDVSENQVIIKRRDQQVAKITHRAPEIANTAQVTPTQQLVEAIREFNNLHPADASGKRQPRLSLGEVLAVLKWKQGNGELSDEMVFALRSFIGTQKRVLPAGWRFVGGLTRVPRPDGALQTWEIRLVTNGLSKPILIRQSAIAPPPSKRQPTKPPGESTTGVSLTSMIASFNEAHPEINRRDSLPHELPPLTLDEVLAAIEIFDADYERFNTKGSPLNVMQQIMANHHVSAGTRLELHSEIENAIGEWFTVECVHLVIPRPNDPKTTDTIQVRKQFIDTNGNHPKSTHWSKPGPSGMQAGVRLIPAQDSYQHGDVVDIEFLYRSTTRQKIAATLPSTFQFGKVRGIRLERVSFVQPKWPDGSVQTMVGNDPLVIGGHRMQICFDGDEPLKQGVNLKAMTRPKAAHYVRFTVPSPTDEPVGESLEIANRLYFRIAPLTPPKVLPLFESHYFQHWGSHIPGHRLPEQSTPDPEYLDPFQIGMSLGPAEASRIPAYYSSGFEVTKVAVHSPAESAGIEVGDILLSWEGNQIHGDDPSKPFRNYNGPNNQLRETLERNAKSRGWGSGNMDFDLLDHRSGEVIRIAPWFGMSAGGGRNKTEIIKRLNERKKLRNPQ